MYILIYVDDMLIACKFEEEFNEMYEGLQQHFNVTALGEGRYFLGIEIERDAIGFHLNQKQNILKFEHHVQDLQRNSIEELPNRKYVSRFF